MPEPTDFRPLFAPHTIAVIGASSTGGVANDELSDAANALACVPAHERFLAHA